VISGGSTDAVAGVDTKARWGRHKGQTCSQNSNGAREGKEAARNLRRADKRETFIDCLAPHRGPAEMTVQLSLRHSPPPFPALSGCALVIDMGRDGSPPEPCPKARNGKMRE
jgi:hypothetical protein